MKHLLLAGLMMTSLSALASGDRGNGGDAMVCRDSKGEIISAEVLDLYEGRVIRSISYDEDQNANFREMVTERLELLGRFDSPLMEKIKAVASGLVRNARNYESTGNLRVENVLFSNQLLEDVPDSGHLTFDKGCKVEQLAIRTKKEFSEDPDFIIQKDIWAKLSQLNKSALILHEAIYKVFAERGDTNSKKARYFNQKLHSLEFRDSNYIDYLKMASESGIEKVQNGVHPSSDKRFIYTSSVSKYNENLFISKSEGAFNKIVFDAFGKVYESLSRIESPKPLHFYLKSSVASANVTVKINGKEVCSLSQGVEIKFEHSYYEKYEYSCSFKVLEGDATYEISIQTDKRSITNEWIISSLYIQDEPRENIYETLTPKKGYKRQGTLKIR